MIVPRDLGIQAALHCMRSGSKWSAFRSPISSPTHGRGPAFGRVRLVRKRIGILGRPVSTGHLISYDNAARQFGLKNRSIQEGIWLPGLS